MTQVPVVPRRNDIKFEHLPWRSCCNNIPKYAILLVLVTFSIQQLVFVTNSFLRTTTTTTTTGDNIEFMDNNKNLVILNERISLLYATEPIPRPSIETILNNNNNNETDSTTTIIGDTSWLLNYAVIGFPKCGTTTMMAHLQRHSEFISFPKERCELSKNTPAILIHDLYHDLPSSYIDDGRHQNSNNHSSYVYKLLKCPDNAETPIAIQNYNTYFPYTDFIIGIRHPVLWFESYYNYRMRTDVVPVQPPNELMGDCNRNNRGKERGVCALRGGFHWSLSMLGKTNLFHNNNSSDEEELQYFPMDFVNQRKNDSIPTKRRIFLFEISQLSDPDPSRDVQFRIDMQNYLRMKEPLEPFTIENHYTDPLPNQFNICDTQYDTLRDVLMIQAINASKWIRHYFIHSKDVYVSSINDYFENTIMKSWEIDPCSRRLLNNNTQS